MSAVFDRLLSSLDLKIDAFGYCEVHSGWRLSFPPSPIAHVHYVLQGSGRLAIAGREPIPLAADTFVLIPSAVRGVFETGSAAREVGATFEQARGQPYLQHLKAGDGGDMPLVFICGTVMLDSAGRRILLDPLGEAITSDALEAPIAPRAMEQLLAELTSPRVGSRPIVEQLLRLCLLLLLRMQHEKGRYPEWMLGTASSGLLEKVILKLIDMPEGDFSIEKLAQMAGMSRTSFLRIFAETVGQSPSEFVRDLRLKQAARLLATTRRAVERIAGEVGYDSRSHFSRLFKTKFGIDPTEYRRVAQEG